jgi:hypothetical protein
MPSIKPSVEKNYKLIAEQKPNFHFPCSIQANFVNSMKNKITAATFPIPPNTLSRDGSTMNRV